MRNGRNNLLHAKLVFLITSCQSSIVRSQWQKKLELGMRTGEQFCPEHNVTLSSVWFWKGKKRKCPSKLVEKRASLLKMPQTRRLTKMSSKSTEPAWKWRKSEKIAWVSGKHSRVVVRPWSELANATLWLAHLHLRAVFREGSINTWHQEVIHSLLSAYLVLFFVSLALFTALNRRGKTREKHVKKLGVANQSQSGAGLAKKSPERNSKQNKLQD